MRVSDSFCGNRFRFQSLNRLVGAGGLAMGRVQRTDAGVGVERNKKGKSKKKKEQTYKDRKDFLLLARQKKRRPAQKQKSVEQRKKIINK